MRSLLRLVRFSLTLSLVPRWSGSRLMGLVGLLFIGSAQLSQAQYIAYVTQGGNGARTGGSWANAFSGSQLQSVFNGTPAGGQVWVAAGTYKPTTDNNRNSAFSLRNGVAVYGGFAGNETSLDQRPLIDPVAGKPSSTTLSGEIGDPNLVTDNSLVLIFNQNVDNTARLDGVVLTGAYNDQVTQGSGSMANLSSSPMLEKLTFQGNTAYQGGGIYNFRSSPSLTNCSFIRNTAIDAGGGIYNASQSSPGLTNCSFSQNSAKGAGGGIYYQGSSNPLLTRCRFSQNTTDNYGGGIFNATGAGALTDCDFTANTAKYGGGIHNQDSSTPALINCRFSQNTATIGGGIYNYESTPTLRNSSLSRNTSLEGGGALANYASSPILRNCSFSLNNSPLGGGIRNVSNSSGQYINCIFWQNGGQNTFYRDGNSRITAIYCLIDPTETDYTGTNILQTDPLFVSATNDDLRLTACSPAINAGDPGSTIANSGTTDLAGDSRFFQGGRIDMGAYEFQGNQILAITQQPASSSSVCVGTPVRVPVGISGMVSSYQWYKDGVVVSGQTSATLTLPAATTASSASYVLVATGSCNSLTTTAFNLSVASFGPDSQPLVDLYNSSGGASWTRKDNWLTGCTPCNWYGVSCTNGRVTGLNLIGNNLVGTLPASLSTLTGLTSLELGANALTGGIPSGISSLTALQTLNLSRTQLGGTIPASLGQLTQLQNLLLNESALTGALPASLGNLPQLQNLQLYTNQLGGCFPGNYTSLCGRAQINFTGNPNLPGGGDFGAFCSNGTGSELVISQAPSSATACVGSPFSFSFVARGAASYQWYRDGQRLAESGPVLSFSAVSAADAGTYQAYINYGCGSGAVQSDYFTLTTRSDGACPASDLVPLLYVSPGLVYGPSSVSVVVSVVNVGALATRGSITLRISRDPMLQLSLPASATAVGSRTVQNALWSLDSSDPDVYVLRSSQGLGLGSQRSVGLVGSLVVGNTRGQLSVSAVLESGSGGEVRITNNTDAEKMDYFNK